MAPVEVIAAQITFICVIYIMAFVAGILPNVIPWCKKSTNVLGIANAFSGGVFLAIAFMHILPEVASGYAEYIEEHEAEEEADHEEEGHDHGGFPLPFALVFVGYAFILLIDKVIFDTHSLVGEHHHGHVHDPVQANFINNAKSSFIKFQRMVSGDQAMENNHNNCVNEDDINEGIKQYLSRNNKFAIRMSVALRSNQLKKQTSRTFVGKDKGLADDDEQAELFHDKANINLRDTANGHDEALIGHEHPPKKL